MISRESKTIVFVIDYDGCVAKAGTDASNFSLDTQLIIDDMVSKIELDDYDVIHIISASLRACLWLDWLGNLKNKTMSSFQAYTQLTESLQEALKLRGIKGKVVLDKMLLSDIHGNVPIGTNFDLSKKYDLTDPDLDYTRLKDYIAFGSEDKFILLSTIFQYISCLLKNREMANVYYYDDKGNSCSKDNNLIGPLFDLFEQCPQLIPKNQKCHAVEFVCGVGVKSENYPIIQGRGTPCRTSAELRKRSINLLLECLAQDVRASAFKNARDIYAYSALTSYWAGEKYDDQFCLHIDIASYLELYKKALSKKAEEAENALPQQTSIVDFINSGLGFIFNVGSCTTTSAQINDAKLHGEKEYHSHYRK